MKIITVTNKTTRKARAFGSWVAVFENFTPAELGITYRQVAAAKLAKFETQNFEFQVFAEVEKSSKRQAAGRTIAAQRGLAQDKKNNQTV
jgi:hypothetical protein